jgi:hypothetical protein
MSTQGVCFLAGGGPFREIWNSRFEYEMLHYCVDNPQLRYEKRGIEGEIYSGSKPVIRP